MEKLSNKTNKSTRDNLKITSDKNYRDNVISKLKRRLKNGDNREMEIIEND